MSVIVVRSGPDAAAGSCPSRFSTNGTTPPIDTAIMVFSARAMPITAPSQAFPFHSHATMPIRIPSAMPLITPTDTSLSQTRIASLGWMMPRLSSRMVTPTA
jgi:hypothetical protein